MNRLARLYDRPPTVTIHHPESAAQQRLATALSHRGWSVRAAGGSADAVRAGVEPRFDAVVLGGPGMVRACAEIAAHCPEVPVVLVAADVGAASSRAALRAGAFQLVGDGDPEPAVRAVARALWHRGLERALAQPIGSPEPDEDPLEALVGRSTPMRRTRTWLRTIARSAGTVIVSGETGTGKGLAARTLHGCSARSDGPFVALNCAAIPPHLLESMLFGHTRGAFTDARDERLGLLQQADGGTLLLDEIVCLPLPLQAKLLRALENRAVRPVGSHAERPFDVRVIVTTQRALEAEVQAGRFRRDLYYRLAVFELRLPPLRERDGDVLLLARRLLDDAAARMGKPVRGLTPRAARRLIEHDWPGNVRELQNRIEAAVALAGCDHLRARDFPRLPAELLDADEGGDPSEVFTLDALEEAYIRYVSEHTSGNKSETARILGIDRKTVQRHRAKDEAANERALRWIRAATRRVATA